MLKIGNETRGLAINPVTIYILAGLIIKLLALKHKKVLLATNYVLIDFENVQPSNLEVLKKHQFKVLFLWYYQRA